MVGIESSFVNAELVKSVEVALERLSSWVGQTVRIEETISRALFDGGFSEDRHFSTTSVCLIRIQYAGWRFSGSALMIQGKQEGQDIGYEVSIDSIFKVDLSRSDQIVLAEKFEAKIERRSSITLIASG